MSIRRLAVLAALVAIGGVALAATPASAHTRLRLDPGNTAWTGATTVTNTTSTPLVWSTSIGTLTCQRTDVDIDLASHTSSTAITGSLTALTFTGCTDTIGPVNYTGCHLHQPTTAPGVSITGTSAVGGTIAFSNVVVRCNIQNSTLGCYFAFATMHGTVNNTTSSISFPTLAASTVQPTTDALAAGLCGAVSTVSVTLTHLVQGGTNKTVTVAN